MNWKNFERSAAKKLKGKRILRGADFSESRTDVDIPDMPFLKIDCKYRKQFLHHSIFKEIKRKYCKEEGDAAVLLTKEGGKKGFLVVIENDFFEKLLSYCREEND